jgi:hypothetical protein
MIGALPASSDADGAAARRGGRSITEAYVPWGTPGMAAALYIDDSFPKAVGPFGANPSSMGRVLVKHGIGLAEQFAAGVVPQDLAGLPGAEQPVDHKGLPLMLGPDSVIAWTGANNPGYGDPLARDPRDVARDAAHGWLDPADATRAYGVVWTAGGEVDAVATARLRAQRLAERLAGAAPPEDGPPRVVHPGRCAAPGRRGPRSVSHGRSAGVVGVACRSRAPRPGHWRLPVCLRGAGHARGRGRAGVRDPSGPTATQPLGSRLAAELLVRIGIRSVPFLAPRGGGGPLAHTQHSSRR